MANWSLVLPPSRPDVWQLVAITRALDGVPRNEPVAVLGSTPEFRDLLAELRFTKIHIFERNEQFHRLISKDRIYQNEEAVVWGDWLDTLHHTPTRYFAILSDLTSGNVSYVDRARFYAGVARALQDDGLFLDRILSHSTQHELVERLTRKYNELPLNLVTINHFSCEFFFCSELLSINETVDSDRFYAVLRERLKTKRLQRFLDHCPLITPYRCTWWYGKAWDLLAVDYEEYLQIIEALEEPANSPYVGRVRLLISHKRHRQ